MDSRTGFLRAACSFPDGGRKRVVGRLGVGSLWLVVVGCGGFSASRPTLFWQSAKVYPRTQGRAEAAKQAGFGQYFAKHRHGIPSNVCFLCFFYQPIFAPFVGAANCTGGGVGTWSMCIRDGVGGQIFEHVATQGSGLEDAWRQQRGATFHWSQEKNRWWFAFRVWFYAPALEAVGTDRPRTCQKGLRATASESGADAGEGAPWCKAACGRDSSRGPAAAPKASQEPTAIIREQHGCRS